MVKTLFCEVAVTLIFDLQNLNQSVLESTWTFVPDVLIFAPGVLEIARSPVDLRTHGQPINSCRRSKGIKTC